MTFEAQQKSVQDNGSYEGAKIYCFQELEPEQWRFCDTGVGWGGGVLPYICYTGMCRWKGYGFRAIYSGIESSNHIENRSRIGYRLTDRKADKNCNNRRLKSRTIERFILHLS